MLKLLRRFYNNALSLSGFVAVPITSDYEIGGTPGGSGPQSGACASQVAADAFNADGSPESLDEAVRFAKVRKPIEYIESSPTIGP